MGTSHMKYGEMGALQIVRETAEILLFRLRNQHMISRLIHTHVCVKMEVLCDTGTRQCHGMYFRVRRQCAMGANPTSPPSV